MQVGVMQVIPMWSSSKFVWPMFALLLLGCNENPTRIDFAASGDTGVLDGVQVDSNVPAFDVPSADVVSADAAVVDAAVVDAAVVDAAVVDAAPLPPGATKGELRLVADDGLVGTSSELVTFGIPFAPGVLKSLDELAIRDNSGKELPVFVKTVFQWRGGRTGIRAVMVQLSADMTSGDVVIRFDNARSSDGQTDVARLSPQGVNVGYRKASALKEGILYPRVFALHKPEYLSRTRLIAPYAVGKSGDNLSHYAGTLFDKWSGTPFDYSKSTQANWLFDRATAHYKRYMDHGEKEVSQRSVPRGARIFFTNADCAWTSATWRVDRGRERLQIHLYGAV